LIVATVAQALRLDGELAGRLVAQAPRWLTGLLVVLLGVRAALLVTSLSGTPAAATGPIPPAPAVTRNVVDIPSILRANLFGQSTPVAGAAPVTSMALVLAGVIAASDEKLGFAMLGTSSADIKVYRVGATVPGGVRLHAVHVDRVMLDRGGTIEALMMPQRASTGLAPAPVPVAAPAPTASVERVQQIMRENPGIIGQVIQRQAVFADGKLRGMRVFPGPNAQAFNRLGLRAGDLVTAINGTALDDQTRSNEVFNTLSGAADARITVMRNGATQDLQLNLAEIANEAERLAQSPAPPPAPAQPMGPESAR
jgi:general secretion pathway protein C